jgi:hypothetical protein
MMKRWKATWSVARFPSPLKALELVSDLLAAIGVKKGLQLESDFRL